MTAFAKQLEGEFKRVKALGQATIDKGGTGKWQDFVNTKNSYKARFGKSWREKIPGRFSISSIQELADWVIDEGDCIFADTRFASTWMIYHDALP